MLSFMVKHLAGNEKPNLMYMTTFSDMKSHDELWKAFGGAPEWKKMSGLEEYKNTVSKKQYASASSDVIFGFLKIITPRSREYTPR